MPKEYIERKIGAGVEREGEKMAKCEKCVHKMICAWCAENTSLFNFPSRSQECEAFNNDFDEVEEAVANACANAKRIWEEVREDDDREKGAFCKGRWSAFKDVLEIMSYKGA